MTEWEAWATGVGFLLGAGLWLIFVRMPAMRRVPFAERVAPQLRSGRPASRLLAAQDPSETPFGPLGRILRPLLTDLVAWANRLNPVGGALEDRLAKAGLRLGGPGLPCLPAPVVGGGVSAGRGLRRVLGRGWTFNGLFSLVLLAGSAVGGFCTARVVPRRADCAAAPSNPGQFPSVAELMALAVGAGDTTVGAIEQVYRSTPRWPEEYGGPRRGPCRHAAGQALGNLFRRVNFPVMTRFVDAITVATERGTPLAQVLRARPKMSGTAPNANLWKLPDARRSE